MISYDVQIAAPHTHTATVVLRVPDARTGLRFGIPAWTPGSYLLREFARYLSEPICRVSGREVSCTKVERGVWELGQAEGELEVTYDVYSHELTVRTPHIDGSHAYFLGTNALCYVEGRENQEHRLAVSVPDAWTTYCALPQDGPQFVAENYDVMADTPVEAGPDHIVHEFDALGVPHRFIFWGADSVNLDLPKLEADTRALIETNAKTFDGALPYDNYDIVFHVVASGRGGLEHLNSTVLQTPWRYFDTDKGYKEMLELISHEHFHVWNVKRIRPAALGPFDYQNENHTTALWVVEGFTSYFDALNCVRAEVVDTAFYLDRLSQDLTRFNNTPGRSAQTVAQSSWDAWIRLYRPDDNTPNRTVSYYLKGALVSLVLDLTIRSKTAGKHSLRDVINLLWDDFKATGSGYSDDSIPEAIRRATGLGLDQLVGELVHSTDDPNFDDVLATHGVEISRDEPAKVPWLGLDFDVKAHSVAVKHVRADGPSYGGPVYPGDTIVAVNGRQVTPKTLPGTLETLVAGEDCEVHAFRRGRLFAAKLTPAAPKKGKFVLNVAEDANAEQLRLFELWTGGKPPIEE